MWPSPWCGNTPYRQPSRMDNFRFNTVVSANTAQLCSFVMDVPDKTAQQVLGLLNSNYSRRSAIYRSMFEKWQVSHRWIAGRLGSGAASIGHLGSGAQVNASKVRSLPASNPLTSPYVSIEFQRFLGVRRCGVLYTRVLAWSRRLADYCRSNANTHITSHHRSYRPSAQWYRLKNWPIVHYNVIIVNVKTDC